MSSKCQRLDRAAVKVNLSITTFLRLTAASSIILYESLKIFANLSII